MFTSKRGLFSAEHGATTSWLAGITSAALLVASIALPAVALDEGATPEPTAAAEEVVAADAVTVEETPAEEAPAEEAAPADEAVVDEPPAEEAAAEEAVIDVPLEDEVVDDPAPAVAEEPAPPAEEPASEEPAPVEEKATASATDGETPDINSPPVEEYVAGVKVKTDSDSATILWPEFGLDDNYTVQMERKNGTWKTLDATVEDAPASSTRDYKATIDDLEAGREYTVRIVTADTQELAEATTEDAVGSSIAGPGFGSIARAHARALQPTANIVVSHRVVVSLVGPDGTPITSPNVGTFEQWADVGNEWINGALNPNKSNYREKEVVPFRLELKGLTAGETKIVPICRDYLDGKGTFGYTQIRDYDASRPDAEPGGTLVTDTTGSVFDAVGLTIVDSMVLNEPDGEFDGYTFECNGDITKGAVQALAVIKVTALSTSGYLLWGGRLSGPYDSNPVVPFGSSSSYFTGGSLQFQLEGATTSRQIFTAGITPLIPVSKYNDLNANGLWDKPDESGIASWDFFVDLNENGVKDDNETAYTTSSDPLGVALIPLDPGTYTICEVLRSGWTNTDPGSATTIPGKACEELKFSDKLLPEELFFGNTQRNSVTLEKTWVNGVLNDTAALSIAGGTQITPNRTSTSNGDAGSWTDPATVSRSVLPGAQVTVAELLGGSNTGSYNSSLSCTGGVTPDKDGVFTMPNTAVTCTYTNTRIARAVTLEKTWVNGVLNDTAALSIAGGTQITPNRTSTSNGDAGSWTDPATVSRSVLPGAQVTVAELLGGSNTGSYNSSLSCTGGVTPDKDGVFTMPNTAVTCTYTNTRIARAVTLEKTWVNGVLNDTAALSIAGGTQITPNRTSTSNGDAGSWTDPATVSRSVLPGAQVTVAELLGGSNTGSYNSSLSCTGGVTPDKDGVFTMPNTAVTCTYTNTRIARAVTLEKTWVNGVLNDTAALSIAGGTQITPNRTSTSNGDAGSWTDPATVSRSVLPGAQVTVAELLGGSNTGSYNSSLSCTGGVTPDKDGVFTMPNTAVTCTYTNTRIARAVTLEKTWVNGVLNDTAALSIAGGTQITPNRTSTSNGDAGSWTDPATVSRSVLPGAQVTVAELLGGSNTGSYNSSLSCTGGVTPDKDGVFTMPNTAVTCTYTNTRIARAVTLEKTWVNGVLNDTAALSIAGGTQITPNRTSTSNGDAGSWTDPATVSRSVLPGAQVTVAELLGGSNTGSYNSSLSCTGGVTPDKDGVFTMPNTAVTCTYTNTRIARAVTLEKTWVNGVLNDTAALSIAGGTQITPNRTSTSNGDAGSWTDPATVSRSVLPGAQVTVAELLGGSNTGSYNSSLSCTGGVTPDKDGVFTMPNTAVTCTYTNTRIARAVTLEKTWVNGVLNDTAALSIAGGTQITPNRTSTSNGDAGSWTDPATVSRSVLPGAQVTVAELLGGSNTGSYNSSLSCTGGVTPDKDGVFTMPNTAVTCTYTNTRIARAVTLEKTWVNGVLNDTAALSIAGGTQITPNRTSTSNGDAGSWTDPATVSRSVLPGAQVTVAELLGGSNTGSYNSSLSCTGGVTPDKDGVFTMPNTAVTCTYTNTRTSNDVVLQKEWVNSAVGDTADLKIIGGLEDPAEATSTSDGGSYLDDEDTASTLVYSGETVTVSEILGEDNLGTYTSALLCTTAGEEGPEEFNITGTFTMPNTTVTCTYTNTRTSNDVVLQKEWVNSAVGDTADLKIIGGLEDPAEATSTSDGGSYLDDEDTASTLVYSGETVTVSEILGEDNLGTYTSALLCTTAGEEGPEEFNITGTFTMPNTTVTCTYTNTRTKGDLVIKKVVVGDVAGASTDFMVDVVCSPGSGFNYSRVPLTQANEWTATLTGIHSGLSCVVTEASVPAGWVLTTISPSPAVIGGEPVTVTVTNTRTVGDLVIKKVVVGPIEGVSTDFTVNVDCTPGTAYDKTGVVLNQANNWTITYTGIPTGVSCVVTEPVVPAGWTLTSIAPSPAVIGSSPVTVTVTNTRNGIPGLDKTSAIEDGGPTVEPGDVIDYTVAVSNTGGLPISGPVVDTLPAGLTVVAGTVSGGGTPNTELTQITWQVTLAPGETQTFTYKAIVGDGVETGDSLVNLVTFQGLQDSTATPVELPPVAPIEEEVVGGTEDLAKTGADYVAPLVTAALLALLAGGLMVVFGRRRRYNA